MTNFDMVVTAYCPSCRKNHRIERHLFDLFGTTRNGNSSPARVIECRDCNQGTIGKSHQGV